MPVNLEPKLIAQDFCCHKHPLMKEELARLQECTFFDNDYDRQLLCIDETFRVVGLGHRQKQLAPFWPKKNNCLDSLCTCWTMQSKIPTTLQSKLLKICDVLLLTTIFGTWDISSSSHGILCFMFPNQEGTLLKHVGCCQWHKIFFKGCH